MSDGTTPVPTQYGMDRQMQVYLAGLIGQRPPAPVAVEALERHAKEVLSAESYGYVAGGAGAEETMRANLEAFRRRRIVPRLLRNVAMRDLGVDILGQRLPAPVLLAPIGVQSIVHPEAGTGRGSRRLRARPAYRAEYGVVKK